MLYPLVLLVCLVGAPPPCPSAEAAGGDRTMSARVMPAAVGHPGDVPPRRDPLYVREV